LRDCNQPITVTLNWTAGHKKHKKESDSGHAARQNASTAPGRGDRSSNVEKGRSGSSLLITTITDHTATSGSIPDAIVDGAPQFLPASQITFCRLK
jgi:hypothetical protein